MLSDEGQNQVAAAKLAISALESIPKGDKEATRIHIEAALIIFWGALWGMAGSEYARGFIEAQLRGMEGKSETWTRTKQ